jgi:hypothetical protein
MGRGIDDTERLRQERHTALWSSFVRLEKVSGFAPEAEPVPMHELVGQLCSYRDKIPRPLMSIAVWNLLPNYLAAAPPLDDLTELLEYIGVGRSREEITAIYDLNRHPLIALARQYSIIDYNWSVVPTAGFNAVSARLELCVLTPIDSLREVVFPNEWPQYSNLFWGEMNGDGLHPDGWRDSVTRRMAGELRLPGRTAAPLSVRLEVAPRVTGLGSQNTYRINDAFPSCGGTFTAAKELGRPGATRITHERSIDFGPEPPDGSQLEMLAYWLQADTVSLVLPH